MVQEPATMMADLFIFRYRLTNRLCCGSRYPHLKQGFRHFPSSHRQLNGLSRRSFRHNNPLAYSHNDGQLRTPMSITRKRKA